MDIALADPSADPPAAGSQQCLDTSITDALIDLGLQLIRAILDGEDLHSLRLLLDVGAPVWYQEEEEGMSALHAAAHVENPEVVKLLIEHGALWNAVDNLGYTAGDVSLSLNDESCYELIRNAGIRSECLHALLRAHASPDSQSSTMVFRVDDVSAAASMSAFLTSPLRFVRDAAGQEVCMVSLDNGEDIGVMMGWERGIMQETVNTLCGDHENRAEGLKILNVGFGLGIIDTLFQSLSPPPALHIIIEPHPDVLRHMKQNGWHSKRGVKILEGKWQDFVGTDDLLGVGGFDVVYTDTFAEDYNALREFFGHLPDLLAGPESRFSFFNGLGATNALFYDVYTRLSEIHLADVGLNVEWNEVDVSEDGGDEEDRWQGSRAYFKMPIYLLPLGSMVV